MSARIVPVIMCGGAGTRLWPVSRESMPKQFVPFIGGETTFQQVLARVRDRELFERLPGARTVPTLGERERKVVVDFGIVGGAPGGIGEELETAPAVALQSLDPSKCVHHGSRLRVGLERPHRRLERPRVAALEVQPGEVVEGNGLSWLGVQHRLVRGDGLRRLAPALVEVCLEEPRRNVLWVKLQPVVE